jgi:hypothetical protein
VKGSEDSSRRLAVKRSGASNRSGFAGEEVGAGYPLACGEFLVQTDSTIASHHKCPRSRFADLVRRSCGDASVALPVHWVLGLDICRL